MPWAVLSRLSSFGVAVHSPCLWTRFFVSEENTRITSGIRAVVGGFVSCEGEMDYIWRHSDDFAKSRIVVADGDQVLVSLVLDEVVRRKNEKDVAISVS